ncbi:MAG: DUF839 domain-containing protein [Candidatus Methanosuratincola sp.]|jgi:hypothetical protein
MTSVGMTNGVAMADPFDFGLLVEKILSTKSLEYFGILKPLPSSAFGPYTGSNNTRAIIVAKGLQVSAVSNGVHNLADMIALWPNDENPTHLFVCIEDVFSGNDPTRASVQRINLSGNPDTNAETIVKGISSCDPIRRTPWGTLAVGEEAGKDGGFYEIFDPIGIDANKPAVILDRSTGESTDPRVVKRMAVGSLSWEGNVILKDGTMYYGDELRPNKGAPGGGIYKFVPDNPYDGKSTINDPAQSPFASGKIYGMRLGTRSGNTDWGQGSETGKGIWIEVNPKNHMDAHGNIILRDAQSALGFTGYYRPEDMDIDPIAANDGKIRVCWTNTGRMTNGVGSAIENAANYGEVLCLEDEPRDGATTNRVPFVTRFLLGDPDANHFDNLAFQPHTGRLIVLEDGEVEVLGPDGTLKELRGNDIWMCLPDGKDRNTESDGCIRIASLTDTEAEPTGFIFDESGKSAYLNIMHRSTGKGALIKISGFIVK